MWTTRGLRVDSSTDASHLRSHEAKTPKAPEVPQLQVPQLQVLQARPSQCKVSRHIKAYQSNTIHIIEFTSYGFGCKKF